MPKGGKKGQKKNSFIGLADIKLSDYANSSHAGSVRKKVFASTKISNLYALEKAWLNQESEEFKNDDDEFCSNPLIKKKTPRSLSKNTEIKEQSGNVYPIDLWYILADYIEPEDVKIFALICKDSYHVSQTYSFWMKMYKRNYGTEKQLPIRLQPHVMERPLCLKARVIQALYHFYPKFSSKSPTHSQSWEVDKLVTSPCVAMWHMRSDNEWMFFFKFQSRLSTLHSELVVTKESPPSNWMDLDQSNYEDPDKLVKEVNCNPEDGYKILQIRSPYFVATPIVLGGCLVDAKMGLTRDLTKQKLQLIFCFSNYKQKYKLSSVGSRTCGGNAEIIEFDPVGSVVVLDWWNPRYPSTNKF